MRSVVLTFGFLVANISSIDAQFITGLDFGNRALYTRQPRTLNIERITVNGERFNGERMNGERLNGKRMNGERFTDSLPADTIKKAKIHSPKKASLMSALLPGLGQVYNKKYWKVPIIYAALGGLGYGFGYNQKFFKYYKDALHVRYDDDPTTFDPLPLYSDAALVTLKNYYQRYRDLCVIGMAAVYTLQILDAAVDAHLFYFDVGPDLSMHWSPEVSPSGNGLSYGVGLHLGFK